MKYFLPIFKALNEESIRYLVAGGLATVLHGYQRMTGDIDLILDLENRNCTNALKVFEKLGFKPRVPLPLLDFANEQKRREWIETKGMKVFSLHGRTDLPIEIDLFVEIPATFEEYAVNAEKKEVDGIDIPILSIPDLIQLKKRANRPQDLEDIRALEMLSKE